MFLKLSPEFHYLYQAEFEAAGCKIFQFSSKDANCILSIDPQTDKPLEDYQTLIGETVYVEYPHLVEALVVGGFVCLSVLLSVCILSVYLFFCLCVCTFVFLYL